MISWQRLIPIISPLALLVSGCGSGLAHTADRQPVFGYPLYCGTELSFSYASDTCSGKDGLVTLLFCPFFVADVALSAILDTVLLPGDITAGAVGLSKGSRLCACTVQPFPPNLECIPPEDSY